MALLSNAREVLGDRYRDYAGATVRDSLDNPLLFAKPARVGMRLFGSTPVSVLRAVPTSLPYVYRDAGAFGLSIHDDYHATVTYEGFPPAFSEGDCWSLSWLGAIDALVAFSSHSLAITVEVSLTQHDPSRGNFEWKVACRAHGASS
jgi:hypothetical protein